MEPEQSAPVAESQDKFESLKKVTPLSKYLAMALFIIMPFIGGWIGYRYAPEKVVEVVKVVEVEKNTEVREVVMNGGENVVENNSPENITQRDGEPSNKLKLISIQESEDENFMCNHSGLNELRPSEYADWPVYTATDYGISFSYPLDEEPNFEDRYSDDSGKEHLRVGYNPNINSSYGKPTLYDLDSNWEVEIIKGVDRTQVDDSSYCAGHNVCLVEEVRYDFGTDFYTYVSTFDELMTGAYLREYDVYLHEDYDGNIMVRVSNSATSGLEMPVCAAVMSVTNLDKIARSIEFKE